MHSEFSEEFNTLEKTKLNLYFPQYQTLSVTPKGQILTLGWARTPAYIFVISAQIVHALL